MKTTQFMGRIWAPTALLGLTAVLLMPAPRSEGYAFLGGSLSTSQRARVRSVKLSPIRRLDDAVRLALNSSRTS